MTNLRPNILININNIISKRGGKIITTKTPTVFKPYHLSTKNNTINKSLLKEELIEVSDEMVKQIIDVVIENINKNQKIIDEFFTKFNEIVDNYQKKHPEVVNSHIKNAVKFYQDNPDAFDDYGPNPEFWEKHIKKDRIKSASKSNKNKPMSISNKNTTKKRPRTPSKSPSPNISGTRRSKMRKSK